VSSHTVLTQTAPWPGLDPGQVGRWSSPRSDSAQDRGESFGVAVPGLSPSRQGDVTDDLGARLVTLLDASGGGDEQAFAQLYDLTSPRVYGLVLRVLRDAAQAAEVTQDIYVEVWKQSARYDSGRGAVLTWMLTIAHGRAVDRVRSSQASVNRDIRYAELDVARPYDHVSEQAIAGMEGQRVRKALTELPPAQREAVTLAYFGGHTHSEVAGLLQIPLGTAKTRIRDGLVRMRLALGVPS
jgi:RNA polymerase sigma-70 factor (ECF subfamily)